MPTDKTDRPSLLEVLTLEASGPDQYRSTTPVNDRTGLYGGQVMAQALVAAATTAPAGATVHSLHAYFLRRGDPRSPVTYLVDRDRDGRSFFSRRVSAVQDGQVLLTLASSFHHSEAGPDLQAPTSPDASPPEGEDRLVLRTRAIDVAVVAEPYDGRPAPSRIWMRVEAELGDDLNRHAAAIAYASDMFSGLFLLADIDEHVALTTLDHAIWFYRPARADQWLLMDMVPVSIAHGRGMYSGHIFSRDGTLLSGLTQESLYRHREQGRRRTMILRED